MNLKKVVKFFASFFALFRRKPKRGVVYSKDIVPVSGEESRPFRERKRGNNRKPTRGRRLQTIDLGNGRFKFIKHNPVKK
jgi:hypothetical protein